jgi:multidrug efflux pump subunit AcrA (membrane-fusion protein)
MIVDKHFVAREKKVTVGVRSGDQIEIVEGLAEGDTVVVEGNFALPDGTRVEIAKDEEEEGNKNEDKKGDKEKD